MAESAVVIVNSTAEWQSILAEAGSSGKAVVVDFYATWCGPCRLISPYFAELSKAYPSVVFVKIDVDKLEEVAQSLGITAMPTFQVFKAGAKVDELVGASKDKLKALIEKYA